MAAVVSAEEFGALQEQLMKLKEEKYEGLDREKKLKREIERLTKAHADAESLAKKNTGTGHIPHCQIGWARLLELNHRRRTARKEGEGQCAFSCNAREGLGPAEGGAQGASR